MELAPLSHLEALGPSENGAAACYNHCETHNGIFFAENWLFFQLLVDVADSYVKRSFSSSHGQPEHGIGFSVVRATAVPAET